MWKVIVFVGIFIAAKTDHCCGLDINPLNEFSLKILNNTFAIQEKVGKINYAVSPMFTWSLLSLLAGESTGETYGEIIEVLKLPNDTCAIESLYLEITDKYTKESYTKPVFAFGKQAIFTNASNIMKDAFSESATYYHIQICYVFANHLQGFVDGINDYFCYIIGTRFCHKKVVLPEFFDDPRMVFIDSFYFGGYWTHPFNKTHTTEKPFYNSEGESIGTVNMMYQKAPHYFGESVQVGARILEMTYGENEQFSMLVLVPLDGVPLKKMINNLATQPLDWMTEFKKSGRTEIDCYIPRFTVSSIIDLINTLKDFGIKRIFESMKAEMTGIAYNNTNLFVTRMLQHIQIDVNENSITEAAATAVNLENTILGKRFEANKEFAFLVLQSGVILHAGVYVEPRST